MHESQLAQHLLEAVLARAETEKALRILSIKAWLSDPEGLSPESLAFQFTAHARGTLAEGARLHLSISRLSALCRVCDTFFEAEGHVPQCPECGSLDCPWSTLPEIGIDEMEIVSP